ncbi:MAG: DUF5522 domain-containing protein [Bdellovibrionota bacterium]
MSQPPWQAAYDEAVRNGAESYLDPQTGFAVLTELGHKKRGYCCQSGCRHCPFGFKLRDALARNKRNEPDTK